MAIVSVQENIEAIRKLEEEFLRRRTLSERLADRIAGFAGSMVFIGIHLLWLSAYIIWNPFHLCPHETKPEEQTGGPARASGLTGDLTEREMAAVLQLLDVKT